MYETCKTVSEVNVARHADSVLLMDLVNAGKITDESMAATLRRNL